jgi:hypothetical protein
MYHGIISLIVGIFVLITGSRIEIDKNEEKNLTSPNHNLGANDLKIKVF